MILRPPEAVAVPEDALFDPAMTLTQLRVLFAVALLRERKDDATAVELAKASRIDFRRVQRAVAALESRGYVTRVRRTLPNGGSAPTVTIPRWPQESLR